MVVFKPNSHCPEARSTQTYSRNGLTLTELLVVIAILVVVTAVLAPLLGPSLDGREVREAARQVNAYFQQAQAKAKQLGRPVGVVIQRAPNYVPDNLTTAGIDESQDYAYQLSLAESPPPFRGFGSADRARFLNVDDGGRVLTLPVGPNDGRLYASATIQLVGSNPMASPDLGFIKTVQANDHIRFNFRGSRFRIYSVIPMQNNAFEIRFLIGDKALPRFSKGSAVPFEVYQRPRMSSSTPLELPAGSAMVMNLSGVGMDYYLPGVTATQGSEGIVKQGVSPRQKYIGINEFRTLTKLEAQASGIPFSDALLDQLAKLPLTIMFSPDGTIDQVYRVMPPNDLFAIFGSEITPAMMALIPPKRPQDKIYLFIGKDGKDTSTNFADTSNIWVAIDPENGLVTTAPHSPSLDANLNPATNLIGAIAAARQLAATGQSMGGQ